MVDSRRKNFVRTMIILIVLVFPMILAACSKPPISPPGEGDGINPPPPLEREVYTVYIDPNGGVVGTQSFEVEYGKPIQSFVPPTREGYRLDGLYYHGKMYFNGTNGMVTVPWYDIHEDSTWVASWTKNEIPPAEIYTVKLELNGGASPSGNSFNIKKGDKYPAIGKPYYDGHVFLGYFDANSTNGNVIYDSDMNTHGATYEKESDSTLYALWMSAVPETNPLTDIASKGWTTDLINVTGGSGNFTFSAVSKFGKVTLQFDKDQKNKLMVQKADNGSGSETDYVTVTVMDDTYHARIDDMEITCITKKENCIVYGTLITLYDGSTVPVQDLKGDELLLAWDMQLGKFVSAPILFMGRNAARETEIITLYFSDGTKIGIAEEHAFFDFDLNEFVFMREDASQYIGHWFNKIESGTSWGRTQLTNVVISTEIVETFSPVTVGHLNYYTNGLLSMPADTEGLINIFSVDRNTMSWDKDSYEADIAQYGLMAYDEFLDMFDDVPEFIFDAFNGQYFKISVGKGLLDWDTLKNLINMYKHFWE